MFDFMPLEFYSLCFACSTLIEIYGWPQKTGTPNWLGHFSKHAKDRADIYKCMCRIYTSTSLSAVLHLTFDQINLFAYKGRQTKALKKVCLNLLPENEKITQPTGRKNLSEWYKKSFHFCCSVLRVPFLSVPLFFFFCNQQSSTLAYKYLHVRDQKGSLQKKKSQHLLLYTSINNSFKLKVAAVRELDAVQ